MKALKLNILLTLFLFSACSSSQPLQDPIIEQEEEESTESNDPMMNSTTQATLWVQNSAEYKALAMQSYESARRALQLPLQDSFWTASLTQEETEFNSLPPAIILDVDETVLDNSPFQARLILQGETYSNEAWNEWCREANAESVPGAAEFTSYAAEQGVTIFFITNRDHEVEVATRQNLRAEGFPVPDSIDNILTKGEKPGWTSAKVERRKFIEDSYRVIMLFGDDLNDFLSAKNITQDQRAQLVERHANYLGRRWFILPNPVYGSWEQGLIDFNSDLTKEEQREIRIQRLDTKENK